VFGVGIWRIFGVPTSWLEGTGVANRAVDAARGIELPKESPLLEEPGEPPTKGTGNGREDEEPSTGVDM
jgi:hypothetical protein